MQIVVDELQMKNVDIDELRTVIEKAKAGYGMGQLDELHTKLQIAREHLAQAVYSLRNYERCDKSQGIQDACVKKM